MYVIFFMILGSVISWVIFLVLLRSNLAVITVERNCLQDKKMLGVLFRVGRRVRLREGKARTRGALSALISLFGTVVKFFPKIECARPGSSQIQQINTTQFLLCTWPKELMPEPTWPAASRHERMLDPGAWDP